MGSLCGDGVGQASGHCVSIPRSHQDACFTRPPWFPGMKSSKGLISDCAVVRLKTNPGDGLRLLPLREISSGAV